MSSHTRNRTAGMVMVGLFAGYCCACGPFLPNYVLTGGDDVVLKAPVADIQKEIERVKPSVAVKFTAVSRGTDSADMEDLKAALSQKDLGKKSLDRIVEAYDVARQTLSEHNVAQSAWEQNKRRHLRFGKPFGTPPPKLDPVSIPTGLPGEFEDYLHGAIRYHQGRESEAIAIWRGLLRRPSSERRYKSTWAAYMIGRALLEDEPGKASEWFQFVRQLAEDGFVDTLGLAAESFGTEARAELARGNYGRAIELYIVHKATGDPTAPASLQIAAGLALRTEPQRLKEAAANPTARQVITAYLISQGGRYSWSPPPDTAEKWAQALENAEVDSVENADRLAWAAYKGGKMQLAQRWVAVAGPDSVMAQWIEAKLLLRAGDIFGAAEKLSGVVGKFPPARLPRVHPANRDGSYGTLGTYPYGEVARGELAVLKIARRQYVEALDILIKGGFWGDAAYVAESVLSPEELIGYVDRAWPPYGQEIPSESYYESERPADPNWFNVRIRFLLGRRLAQLGRYDEARPYYPPKWQPKLDDYVAQLQAANNTALSNRQRAKAYWSAGYMVFYSRGRLLGTERSFGYTRYAGIAGTRLQKGFAQLVPVTDDEVRRLGQYALPPEGYPTRHVAAEYAWQAAELMPDNSDETAYVLCEAGSWLKIDYPEEADRFYKVLVLRCRKTKLGQEADKLRWFPVSCEAPENLFDETR